MRQSYELQHPGPSEDCGGLMAQGCGNQTAE